jgi:hypothetical protein
LPHLQTIAEIVPRLIEVKTGGLAICDIVQQTNCSEPSAVTSMDEEEPVEFNISSDKVRDIISKAHRFDVKVEPVEPDPASNPIDMEDREVLEDYADDPAAMELREAIDDLNDDEVIDLIAMAWVGRGDYGRDEWAEARSMASERHREHSADYLMGIPTLGDFLEEALATLGYSYEPP